MAKAFSVEFAGFDELNKKLIKLQADARAAAEEALKTTRDIVTAAAEVGLQHQYLPAGGKYDHNCRTASTFRRDYPVKWSGDEATILAGFESKNWPVSWYLIKGTPKMVKDQKLWDAFFGDQVRAEYLAAQKEIYEKLINEAMG